MTFGVSPFGTAPFGAAGAGSGSGGADVYASTAPLRLVVCAGDVVALAVPLAIKVFARYTPALPLQIDVTRPRVQSTVALRIAVFERYASGLPLAINVSARFVAPVSGAAADVWAARVTLGGVDVSARLTGQISIEAEESAARVARFALAPAGAPVALASLARQAVTIDLERFDAAGVRVGLYRLFTGVVDTPEHSPETRVLSLTCSDARQAKIAAMTRPALDALTPGATWSPHVFDRYAPAEQYLSDRLSTLAGAVDGDAFGALSYTPWAGWINRELGAAEILDGSLRTRLAGAASARKTRLSVTYRRPQAVVRCIAFAYRMEMSQQFYMGTRPLTRNAVEQALTGAGVTIEDKINFTPYPDTAGIDGRGAIITSATDAAQLCLGGTAWLNRRYSRWIDENWTVEIGTEGTQTDESRVVSVEWDSTESDTRQRPAAAVTAFSTAKKDGPIPYISPRHAIGETHVDYVPPEQPDAAAFAVAYRASVLAAGKAVAESLRGATVGFSVALDPTLTLRTYARVTTDVASGEGKVVRVAHRLDIAAGSAITDAELECVTATLPDVPALVRPEIPAAIKPGSLHTRAETWVGGLPSSRPWDDKIMFGFSSNVSSPWLGSHRYPEQFSVFVPGIEEAAQGKVTVPPQCSMYAGRDVIEALTDTDGFAFGVAISGAGIPPGTTIVSINTTARTVQLSAACTQTAVEREVRVATRQYIPRQRVKYAPTITRIGPTVGA